MREARAAYAIVPCARLIAQWFCVLALQSPSLRAVYTPPNRPQRASLMIAPRPRRVGGGLSHPARVQSLVCQVAIVVCCALWQWLWFSLWCYRDGGTLRQRDLAQVR